MFLFSPALEKVQAFFLYSCLNRPYLEVALDEKYLSPDCYCCRLCIDCSASLRMFTFVFA